MSLFSSNTNLSYFSFTNLSCSSCNKSLLIFPCKSLLLLLYKSISISQMLPLGVQLAFNILCSILFRGKKENVLPLLLKRSIVDSSAVFLFTVKCTCREQTIFLIKKKIAFSDDEIRILIHECRKAFLSFRLWIQPHHLSVQHIIREINALCKHSVVNWSLIFFWEGNLFSLLWSYDGFVVRFY